MKNKSINTALLLLLAFTGFQCKQNNNDAPQSMTLPTLTGRLVIFDACGRSAIQVLSGPIDSSRLMTSWKNPDNDSIYHNIFQVGAIRDHVCSLSFYGLSKGDTLQFALDPNPQNITCNMCADSNPVSAPPVFNAVTNVKKISATP
jgi:hypothetical protein